MKRILLLLIFTGFLLQSNAQLGGQQSFTFVTLPSSARVAALGGQLISVADDDLNLAFANPALLDSADSRQLALNYHRLFSDVGNGFASYAHHRSEWDMTLAATVQYIDYGSFRETDVFNQDLGEFTANEFLVNIGASKKIDSLFSVGVNAKMAFSTFAEYTANAAAIDLGGIYTSKNKTFNAGLVIRNAGLELKQFRDGVSNGLPFGVDLGFSKRLPNSPLRLSLTLTELQQWDLSYVDPADVGVIDPLSGQVIPIEEATFADKLLLHTNWAMEFMFSDNFHIRLGYDYRRRQELALNDRPGMSGISWGMSMRVSKLYLSYGRARYNQAAATNHIGLSIRFRDFSKS